MADTLPNITIPSNEWVDLYALSGNSIGTKISVENVGVCDVYLAVQATQPPVTHDSYTVLQRANGIRETYGIGDSGLWAYCHSNGGKVNVKEEIFKSQFPVTAYGELLTAKLSTITQISAQYGITDKIIPFLEGDGTATSDGVTFTCDSGAIAGSSALLSNRQVAYKAGLGLAARFTALYGAPQPDGSQFAGLITATDAVVFGYIGETFGLGTRSHGSHEIQELTVTTPASGAENASVTVNGIVYIVPLTSGTAIENANEIASSLDAQDGTYNYSANQDQVVARSVRSTPAGSFAFSSSTAVASWEEVAAGDPGIVNFIPQAQWNVDPRPSLDTTKGNVYQVKLQYLGFGGIEFYIEDPETSKMSLVHHIKFANSSNITSFGNPIFRLGWSAGISQAGAPVTVSGASAAGFVEGEIVRTEPTRALQATNESVTTGSLQKIITIRNRLVFNTKTNRSEIFGLVVTVSTDSNKPVIVNLISNGDFSVDPVFEYIEKDKSISEVSESVFTVGGGRLISSFVVPPVGGVTIDLSIHDPILVSGGVLTIAAQVSSGAASSVLSSIIFQEDL